MTLKARINDDVKIAMKAGDKQRVGALRLLTAAIKQREVDERIEVDDTQVRAILDKLLKQRRESLALYEKAGRADLAAQEAFEADLLQSYLPQALTDTELEQIIAAAFIQTGATSVKDMGQVVQVVRPQVQGRADMAAVSAKIKARFAS